MKNFLITGGTSGIGLNCIRHIVNDHNNRILIVSIFSMFLFYDTGNFNFGSTDHQDINFFF